MYTNSRTSQGNTIHWEGVEKQVYEDGTSLSGSRRTLIGVAEGAKHYELRYFEIPPGGKSSLDMHEHNLRYLIYILRGKTSVLLGMNIWSRVLGTLFTSPQTKDIS